MKLSYTFPLFLVACSSGTINSDKVDNTEIYQTYSIDYNAETEIETASAAFHITGPFGTHVKLNSPAYINFEGKPLLETSLQLIGGTSTFYTKAEKKQIQNMKKEFEFQDSSGQTYRNSIAINQTSIENSIPINFKKNENNILILTGDAIQNNETVSLNFETNSTFLKDEMQDTFICNVSSNIINNEPCTFSADMNSITVNSTALQNFSINTGRMQITRTLIISNGLNVGPKGGEMKSQFTSKWIPITIQD